MVTPDGFSSYYCSEPKQFHAGEEIKGIAIAQMLQSTRFCLIGLYDCVVVRTLISTRFVSQAGLILTSCFGCSYTALVGTGSNPRFPLHKVFIWDQMMNDFIVELGFNHPVVTVRLRQKHMVIVCRRQIHVYTFSRKPERLYVIDTLDNATGLCVCDVMCVCV